METFQDLVDPEKLQHSVPDYLWFLIACGGIVVISAILWKFCGILVNMLFTLKDTVAQMAFTIEGMKRMLEDHEADIRTLQSGKRNRGQ